MDGPQELRPYQEHGRAEIFRALRRGARRLLAVLPTGGGKTTIFTHLADQLARAGMRTLILVHRRELAYQACQRLREFGVRFGLMMAGEPSSPYAPVQVASVPTMARRVAGYTLETLPAYLRFELIVADEAHYSAAPSWGNILALYPRAIVVGFTATPWRLTGKPLADTFDELIVIARPSELREQGFLCHYAGIGYRAPKLDGVKVTGGDYNEAALEAAVRESWIVDDILERWQESASELSTVVFAVTKAHSRELAARFVAAGVKAEHIDDSTRLTEREAILNRVRSGQTRVLCNVGIAIEGIDIPRLKCCVLARPTKSVARAIQMMGRVRRPWNGAVARIHDHAGIIIRHGEPDKERDYRLVAKPEPVPTLTSCPECMAYLQDGVCPLCGFVQVSAPARSGGVGAEGPQVAKEGHRFEFSSSELPDRPVIVHWDAPGRVVEGHLWRRWTTRESWGPQSWWEVHGYQYVGEPKKAAPRIYHVPGTTRLDALMRRVDEGALVRMTYYADTPLGGMRFRKEMKVEVDDGK